MKEKNWRLTAFKYGFALLIGGLLSYAVLSFHGYSTAVSQAERYRILCDAFTIPGVVLMLLSALVWLSNEGAFRGLTFVLTYAVRSLIPMAASKKAERYADYVERKQAQGGVRGYGFLFFTGAGFFLCALLFLVLFYRAA